MSLSLAVAASLYIWVLTPFRCRLPIPWVWAIAGRQDSLRIKLELSQLTNKITLLTAERATAALELQALMSWFRATHSY